MYTVLVTYNDGSFREIGIFKYRREALKCAENSFPKIPYGESKAFYWGDATDYKIKKRKE